MMKEDTRAEYYDRVITWWIIGIMAVALGGTLLFAIFVPEAFSMVG